MTTSTLTSKGQTTVPRELREKLGLKPGDKLEWDREGMTLQVKKAVKGKKSPLEKWAGSADFFGDMDTDEIIREMRGE